MNNCKMIARLMDDRNIENKILNEEDGKWAIHFYFNRIDKPEEDNWHLVGPNTLVGNLFWLTEVTDLGTFEEFMKEIDKLMLADIGMSHMDVEDHDWASEFESECSPDESYHEWKLFVGLGS